MWGRRQDEQRGVRNHLTTAGMMLPNAKDMPRGGLGAAVAVVGGRVATPPSATGKEAGSPPVRSTNREGNAHAGVDNLLLAPSPAPRTLKDVRSTATPRACVNFRPAITSDSPNGPPVAPDAVPDVLRQEEACGYPRSER